MRRHAPLRFGSLVFIALLMLCSCTGKDDDQPTTDNSLAPRLQDIQKAGKLVVGTAITRPFEYYDDNGDLVGFDVDLVTLIASRLNVNLEWREVAFADLLTELDAGHVDMVIAAMYIRPDREEVVDMSQPYLETGLIMAVQADETAITGFEDLAGRTLGVKEGSTGAAYAQTLIDEQDIAINLRIYTDTLDSLDDLANGQIDAVFNDRLNTLVYIQDHPTVRLQGEVFDPAGLGISVKSGDSDLLAFVNSSLDALKASGDIDRLFNRWINPQSQP